MLSPPKNQEGQMDRMKGGEDYEREKGESEGMGLWDLGSPLYDSFELVSLSHLLDRKLMSFTGSPAAVSAASETALSGWFFQSQSSSKLSDHPVGPRHTKTPTMVLPSGLMGRGFTQKKRQVEGENEMRRKEVLLSSSSCGSFAFWRK